MTITANNWKNKKGTADRNCNCGSWKQHWINNSSKSWPSECSIYNCNNTATLGAHVINSNVSGEKIIPSCATCNKLEGEFSLKGGVTVVSANKSETCEK
ncbi:hypothetical protein GCQ56_18855 [Marinifilum sp. N1E240]|uniref:hypothetical protein n=1 Tax=Marinifilum sp. N1E240 TaxID=2608082 RepID=UPI00128C4E5A|nr:hypothetical protein [Marinifilum sp. N1E240]MPQ49063.1 hypothetical protein [Marinifilum sp. N1E240]